MMIFRERAGIISKESCWVFFWKEYMYTSQTLCGLLRKVVTEWNSDLHLVG